MPDDPSRPTLDYEHPALRVRAEGERSLAERFDPRRPITPLKLAVVFAVPALTCPAHYVPPENNVLFVTPFAGCVFWLVGTLVLPRPRPTWPAAGWLSRRTPWLRGVRFAVWCWLLTTGAWLAYLQSNNAPIRMWWHPRYDLAPALQLVLLGVVALVGLGVVDAIDAISRRSSVARPAR